MGMADRASERIGGVGRRVARQGEQAPHHVLHLLFSGVAVADHRLLDLERGVLRDREAGEHRDRKSTRLNSSHGYISYAVFCLKKKNDQTIHASPSPSAAA